MTELTLFDGLILAGVGSSVSASYAIANQILSLKYQNKLEVSKYKIQKIDKSSNEYIIFASYAKALHEILCLAEDLKPSLFYMCKFYFHYFKIIREFGGFELDDHDAETAITELSGDIIELMRKNIEFQSVSLMSKAVTEDDNYSDFATRQIKNEIPITKKFYTFIDDKSHHQKLHDYFLWLSKLLEFEVNYAYKLWYGKEEKFVLDPAFRNYLQKRRKHNLTIRLDTMGKNAISKRLIKLKYRISR